MYYMTTTDIAKRLGVTNRTIRNWIELGFIKSTFATKGGHHRFSQKDYLKIKKFMEFKNG